MTPYEINEQFKWTCYNGELDKVEYYLTSSELKNEYGTCADIHYERDIGILGATAKGHSEIVQYLLGGYNLTEFADFHTCFEEPWRNLYHNRHYEVLYSIISQGLIQKTQWIHNNLVSAEQHDIPYASEYLMLFDRAKLHRDLNQLPIKGTIEKRTKV